MLEYYRKDISERIDINKINASKECEICHYWYFLDKSFNYELYLCNGFHDLNQKSMNFNNVAIASIKGNDYRNHFWYMSKDGAINIMKNSDLKKWINIMSFSYIKKLSVTTYYQRKREVILHRAKKCYQNNKDVLREKAISK